jgi:hypothetical protein
MLLRVWVAELPREFTVFAVPGWARLAFRLNVRFKRATLWMLLKSQD